MVRTTIACSWCRKPKVKCVHDGIPPCRNCSKKGRTREEDCILTAPILRARTTASCDTDRVMNNSDVEKLLDNGGHAYRNSNDQTALEFPSPLSNLRGISQERLTPRNSDSDIILALPPSIITQCASIYARKFPEMAFLHLSSFSGSVRSYEHVKRRVHIAAIFALCCQFLPSSTPNLLSPEDYAAYARSGLSSICIEPPTITVVQALLTLAMYEWGNRNGYGAWMHSGMAIRMMQSIQVLKQDRNRSEREQETQNRTFWACFVMDRLIFCGKNQPLALPMEKMTIFLPIGDQDFAFGHSAGPRQTIQDLESSEAVESDIDSIDNYYSILVRGFEICAKVLEWVINGGRRQPGMTRPHNCPWAPTSPWNTIYRRLQKWRSCQSIRLQYPETPVAIHVSLGHGESVAYVNLLYYICILFLNREYIPFLPTANSEPQGPVDPPYLEAVAPDSWWGDRAKDLFDAADCITRILNELDEMNCPLLTPFPGFCAFSAANMNLYCAAFPRMNLNRTSSAKLLAELNLSYLDRFRQVWKMGNGWWKTLHYTKALYHLANVDHSRFQCKTRADFRALEASIHDYSGLSPPPEDLSKETENATTIDNIAQTDHEAAIGLQSLFSAAMQQKSQYNSDSFGNEFEDDTSQHVPWADFWPASYIWDENQFLQNLDEGDLYELQVPPI